MLGDLGSCPWRELPGGLAGSPEPWEKQRAWVWSTAPSELPAPPQHRAQQLSTARLESRSPGGTPPKSGLRAGAPGMGCGGTARAPVEERPTPAECTMHLGAPVVPDENMMKRGWLKGSCSNSSWGA